MPERPKDPLPASEQLRLVVHQQDLSSHVGMRVMSRTIVPMGAPEGRPTPPSLARCPEPRRSLACGALPPGKRHTATQCGVPSALTASRASDRMAAPCQATSGRHGGEPQESQPSTAWSRKGGSRTQRPPGRGPPPPAALADAVLETSSLGVVMVDGAGRIVRTNARLAEMFGYEQAELDGQSLETLLPERLRAAHARHRRGFFADPRVRPMGHRSRAHRSPQGRDASSPWRSA